jgi:hypothetical protein
LVKEPDIIKDIKQRGRIIQMGRFYLHSKISLAVTGTDILQVGRHHTVRQTAFS